MSRLILIFLAVLLSAETAAPLRTVTYSDIPLACRGFLAKADYREKNFDDAIRRLKQKTSEREVEGENDHLVYYVLQSQNFTQNPRIEPALSAKAFVEGLGIEGKTKLLGDPRFVPSIERLGLPEAARFREFLSARAGSDQRITYLQEFLRLQAGRAEGRWEYLYREYARSMRFLYQKEFAALDPAMIASLYAERGHSTDTQIEANFAVYNALAALKGADPGLRADRILIVGPGLDFAPRTDLVDDFPPQSFQPFAVADALLSLKISNAGRLLVDCVDINPRVIRFFEDFARRRSRLLNLFSGIAESDARPLAPDYKEYFRDLGRNIGRELELVPVPRSLTHRLHKRLRVDEMVASRVHAQRLDILSERFDPSPSYDLVVMTNVLAYFNPEEIALALINIESMLKRGGYFVHNDAREVVSSITRALELPLVQSRTVLIAPGKERPLFDIISAHRKRYQPF